MEFIFLLNIPIIIIIIIIIIFIILADNKRASVNQATSPQQQGGGALGTFRRELANLRGSSPQDIKNSIQIVR